MNQEDIFIKQIDEQRRALHNAIGFALDESLESRENVLSNADVLAILESVKLHYFIMAKGNSILDYTDLAL